VAGVITELLIKMGDKVAEGKLIARVKVGAGDTAATSAAAAPTSTPAPAPATEQKPAAVSTTPTAAPVPSPPPTPVATTAPSTSADHAGHAHASPSVRAFARTLGVDVAKVSGSGPKGRITQADVEAFVKDVMTGGPALAASAPAGGLSGLNLLPWPTVDFAKFGAIELRPLSRIKKISGANLARNWAMIPHVTQFDEADITDLEAFRVASNKELEKNGIKLTMLAFLIKAVVQALKKFPDFNASLDGDNLVLKQYFHIGFAADTPNGLMVPVLRDADKKGIAEIAREMGELAKKARDGKLGPTDMQGGCFSISSLGGIGGTAFTPIINAPEVAILGVSKTQTKPVWDGKAFVPRQMLPLSLSYDHRVIDGAAAARFTSYLSALLVDMRKVLL
jgi:pyruvate dehydrogenase E2 component (dihydrolipoamide acetyltransferase)